MNSQRWYSKLVFIYYVQLGCTPCLIVGSCLQEWIRPPLNHPSIVSTSITVCVFLCRLLQRNVPPVHRRRRLRGQPEPILWQVRAGDPAVRGQATAPPLSPPFQGNHRRLLDAEGKPLHGNLLRCRPPPRGDGHHADVLLHSQVPQGQAAPPRDALSVGHLYYALVTAGSLIALAMVILYFEVMAAVKVSGCVQSSESPVTVITAG